MAFASATLFRFQPSQNLSSRTGQASWRSTSLGTVSVGWSRSRTFPSLTTHRFRISCTAQPETVQKVCEIVRKQLALPAESELTPESKFSALGADSLDTVK
ncbi:hypothetical protein L6164_010895 [Bauhinia variegata]|uniref:Uncharacterized protein n=1 Tax=Bauhinia variegata TaxID=167791 RepID=A0ACB9P805_BAUVA|nr:hypothetical protein L6164_010895 [Bauhinia variegata]